MKLALLLATTAAQAFASTDGKCRALALSGGSNHAVWESGVVWGLLHYGDPAEFTWDAISGISAGSLNTGMFSVYATGDELAMSEAIADNWASIQEERTIFETWEGLPPSWENLSNSVPSAFMNEQGVVNDAPFLEFLSSHILPFGEMKRKWTTGAVDVNSGDFIAMDQDNCPFEDLPTCALASASVPVGFPPRHWNGYVLMDGGTMWDVNIDSAINQCIAMGFKETDIIVDMIIAWDHQPHPESVSRDAIQNWQAGRNIKSYWAGVTSRAYEMREREGIDYRYYFGLTGWGTVCPETNWQGIDFRNSTTWCQQQYGRQNAKDMLELGQDKIHQSLDEWFDSKELQEKHDKSFSAYLQSIIDNLI